MGNAAAFSSSSVSVVWYRLLDLVSVGCFLLLGEKMSFFASMYSIVLKLFRLLIIESSPFLCRLAGGKGWGGGGGLFGFNTDIFV